MDNGLNVFLIFVALLRKELRATISESPSNTVASTSIGEQVKLNCTADMQIAYWFFLKNGAVAEVQITTLGCASVISGFTDHYAVEWIAGGNTCNLIIANITMAQAGVYKCQEGANQDFSILAVTDPSPVITDNSTIAAVEGETVMFECALNYSGSIAQAPTLRPYFYWTNSVGQNVTSYNELTTNDTAVSQFTVAAQRRNNITAYTCHVYFKLNPPTTPNYANNTPIVNSIATSSTIEVLYNPAITSLTSTVSTTDNCIYKQETLTCTADAHPPAEYDWLDLSNNNVTAGAIKSISTGGRYQCIAFNVIRGQRYNDTKIANLTTCVSSTNVSISGTGCVNNFCTCMNHTLERLTLTCMANGYPEPSYQWWSDVPYDQKLEYIEVTTDGNYNCTASNKYGSETHADTASITVSDCTVHLYCCVFKEPYICIVIILLIIYFLLGVGYVIYIWKTGKRKTVFTCFSILKKKLNCLNSEKTEASDILNESSILPSSPTTSPESNAAPEYAAVSEPQPAEGIFQTHQLQKKTGVSEDFEKSEMPFECSLRITFYIVMVIIFWVVVIIYQIVVCCRKRRAKVDDATKAKNSRQKMQLLRTLLSKLLCQQKDAKAET